MKPDWSQEDLTFVLSRTEKMRGFSFDVKGARFGPDNFVIIAGPCAVESFEQTLRIAKAVKASGAHILRGGAFKPRTSPYSFQGLGIKGLRILARVSEQTGLPVVTEALDTESLAAVVECADIVQIGARNMQNFALLREVGKISKPVLLKRGISATIGEWLMSAEYILNGGNERVILCERGIRAFDSHTRFITDFGAIAVVRGLSHLPVLVDPSHSAGRKDVVFPLAMAAAAVGAGGIMVDVHDRPDEALCDGPQAILPGEFGRLVRQLKSVRAALSRSGARKSEEADGTQVRGGDGAGVKRGRASWSKSPSPAISQ